MFSDLKLALRSLLKTPGFTAVAVLTLALGIGVTTAIFSIVHAVILRSLPYPQPERIVQVNWDAQTQYDTVTAPMYEHWSRYSQAFASTAAIRGGSLGFNLSVGAQVERLAGLKVSAGFFQVLAVPMALGRGFLPAEQSTNSSDVVVISHRVWRDYFGGASSALGNTVLLSERPYTIIGVLPRDFRFETPADLILPLQKSLNDPSDAGASIEMLARLKAGVTLQQAQADVDRQWPEFLRLHPRHSHLHGAGGRLILKPYGEALADAARRNVWLLFGAAVLVLLVACANVGNLLLARGMARRGERAIRAALGARRWALMRETLVESALLAAVGSLGGLLLAYWCVPALLSLAPPVVPRLQEIAVDGTSILFAIGICFVTTLLCGLAPAWWATRLDVNEALKAHVGRTSIGGKDAHIRALLIVSQVALACVLLVGAALFARSMIKLWTVESGFSADHVVTAQVSLTAERYATTNQLWAFEERVLTRLQALPGVLAAASTSSLPMERGVTFRMKSDAEERLEARMVDFRAISPQYLDVLKIPLVQGRAFTGSDNAFTAPVALVNEKLAREVWPGRSALGQTLGFWDRHFQVVGVIRDTKDIALDQPAKPTAYVPVAQFPDALTRVRSQWGLTSWLVRTSGSVDVASALRRAFQEVDPQLPVINVRTLRQVVGVSLQTQSFLLLLMAIFAALAVVLAAVGLYGMVSYQVTRSTPEIGIRLALGAQARDLLKQVAGLSLGWALMGILIGLTVAYGLSRLIASLLYEVSPADPMTYVAIAILLSTVALLACHIPARRATKIDPLVALRTE